MRAVTTCGNAFCAPSWGAWFSMRRIWGAGIQISLERYYLTPEFQRGVLDSLRQPIESGAAVIARANAHVRYPARFQLVAAMNPCRCGYLTDPAQSCGRAPKCAQDYQSRISGPLLDRIDIHVEVSE